MSKEEYLDRFVFVGLANLNNGFDAKDIRYFSSSDFATILQRVEKLGLGIYGIEPWKNGNLYDVIACNECKSCSTDPKWFWKAFTNFKEKDDDLLYSATYYIPDRLIECKGGL